MSTPLPRVRPARSGRRITGCCMMESLEQRTLLSADWTIHEPTLTYKEGEEPVFIAEDEQGLADPADYTFAWSALFDGQPIGGESPTPQEFGLDQLPNQGSLEISVIITEDATNQATTLSITRAVSNVAPQVLDVQFFVPPELVLQATPEFEGQPFQVAVVAADQGPEDQMNLTYRLALQKHNGASWVTQFFFEGGVGDFQKVMELAIPDEGSWRLFAGVADDAGTTSSAAFALPILNAAPAPTISGAPASEVDIGTQVNLSVDPNDPGGCNGTLFPSPPYTWQVSPEDHDDTFTYEWTVTRDGNVVATGTDENISFNADVAGDYEYSVTVTDNDGASGSDSGTFAAVAAAGEAMIAYGGLQQFSTSSLSDSTAEISLRASLTDIGGDAAGIGDATVCFSVFHPTDGLVYTAQSSVTSSDGVVGVATDSFTYTLAGSHAALTVVVEVTGGGYAADPISVPLTVSKSETGRISGAGKLLSTASGGLLAAESNTLTHFSFSARRTASSLDGVFSMTYEGANGNTYLAVSTSINSLFTWTEGGQKRAAMSVAVELYQVRRAHGPTLVQSGLTMEMRMTDGGNSGQFDRAAIAIWNSSGGLVFGSHVDPSTNTVTEQLLHSGNLSIWDE